MSDSRLPDLDLEALDAERRAVVEEIVAERGRLPSPFRVWIASAELARSMHGMGQYLSRGLSLSKPEAEIAVLGAARHCDAEYVLAVHAREALEAGLDPDSVKALREGRRPQLPEPREAAVAALIAALLGDGPPAEEELDAAQDALGPAGIADVLALAGYFTAVGLAMKLFAVPPPDSEAAAR